MNEGMIALMITSLGIFAVFIGLFIWGLVSGQFRNVEEPKYRMLEMDTVEDDKKGADANA
jgi:nitrogen fixation-related uncharacterized protein